MDRGRRFHHQQGQVAAQLYVNWSKIDYLGLEINFPGQHFRPSAKHRETLLQMDPEVIDRAYGKPRARLQGYLAFFFAITVRLYGLLAHKPFVLLSLLRAIAQVTKWRTKFATLRKPATVHVDATPTRIAWYDTKTALAESVPRNSTQADNELMAMLLAIKRFGRSRSYATDNPSAMTLGKRSYRHLTRQAIASLTNVRIFYVCTKLSLIHI